MKLWSGLSHDGAPSLRRWLASFVTALLLAVPNACPACTTFVLRDDGAVLFARNLDWFWSDGFVCVNRRGISKTAFVIPPERPVQWVARYGSVTFNQLCRELPMGGMNEKGLIIENMMLPESRYSRRDDRPAINLVQWMQYHLDTCATVEEVIQRSRDVRIERPTVNAAIHYLVADATGAAATFEMIRGRLVVHAGQRLPLRALANSSYRESLEFAHSLRHFGGSMDLPGDESSLARFARAAQCAASFRHESAEADRAYAFDSLRKVAQEGSTVWSIVYDPVSLRIDYRTRDNPEVRWISLSQFDYSPEAEPLIADVEAGTGGNVRAEFRGATAEGERRHILEFVRREDVRRMLGNLEPMVEPLLAVLATYGSKEPEEGTTTGE